MTLFIVRGLPGTGKSTHAKKMIDFYIRGQVEAPIHLEADMYFIQPDGSYKFDYQLIGPAHQWCINTTRIFLNHGKSVIVSNTFTTTKEMKPYLEHAQALGVEVIVQRMTKNYGSIHNVPAETIEKMADRFQDFPGEIIRNV